MKGHILLEKKLWYNRPSKAPLGSTPDQTTTKLLFNELMDDLKV